MTIKEYLKNSPLLFDGAMGTYYAGIHKNSFTKCELANINDRNTIYKIHKEYIDAGCKAIKTNTFGANKVSLGNDFGTVKNVIIAGYEIALKAAKDSDTFVFADIGPIPSIETENLMEDYISIIDIFLNLGATNFLFETFGSDEYLAELSRYIKEKSPQAFIMTEFAVSPDGFTRLGLSGKKLFEKIAQVKTIDAIGFNCVSGPYHLLQYIKNFPLTDKIVSVMPNAGYPTVINNRTFFENSEEYFSSQMLEMAKLGVKILGGCCGTTPAVIQKTAEAIRSFSNVDRLQIEPKREEKRKYPLKENPLIDKMNRGLKIIAVELDPPVDTDINYFMNSAKKLMKSGVDAITIADCPIARARVDSSLLACKLKRELDITPIPHMTCRDRNINATKALLLGLNMEGINNVLVVTGDPIPTAQRDEIKAMFSFNSAILAKYITTLNEMVFSNPFQICGALNVNAQNFDSQLIHAKRKIENGVTMLLTQPVLTEQAFENLKRARKTLSARILGGIMPIISYKNACFINNEISGINVSDEIIEAYKNVTKEQAANLAVKISTKIANEISPYVDGYYIITPFKKIDIVEEIVKSIGQQTICKTKIP